MSNKTNSKMKPLERYTPWQLEKLDPAIYIYYLRFYIIFFRSKYYTRYILRYDEAFIFKFKYRFWRSRPTEGGGETELKVLKIMWNLLNKQESGIDNKTSY